MIKKFFLILICSAQLANAQLVVFDAGGVLFKKDTMAALSVFGFGAALKMFFKRPHLMPNVQDVFYEHLTALPASKRAQDIQNQICCCRDDRGKRIPPILVDWLLGTIKGIEIKKQLATLTIKDSVEKEIMLKAADALNPAHLKDILKPSKEVFKLAKKCKQAGHTIAILSNLDSQSFALFKEMHKDLLSIFDFIIISADIAQVKPCTDVYLTLSRITKVALDKAILIDDQEENIDSAVRMGMNGITFKSVHQVKKELKKLAII